MTAQQNVMQFRVERIVVSDQVPDLVPLVASGQYIMAIKDLNGPITNYTYRPEQVLPHLDVIREAIATERVYTVETDNTASTWPHNPDPRGHLDERILRAIAQRQL